MTEQKIIKAKVFAGSKKEKFIELGEDKFEIYVREPAQNNLANFRVRELLSLHLGVALTDVQIRTGHRSPKKTFNIKT